MPDMTKTSGGVRCLLVEDDELQQRLLRMVLELQGFEVTTASTGLEAVELLPRQTFDLVILDLLMPEMDGVRFLEWLRREAASAVPVIVLSSQDEEVLGDLAKLGPTRYQCKPIDIERFTGELDAFLAETSA